MARMRVGTRVAHKIASMRRRHDAKAAMARLGYDRVFGIGAPKTGTSSFGRAMKWLGYRHQGYDDFLSDCYKEGRLEPILAAADQYEAFEDDPWAIGDLYELLAERHPRARFVLTVRDTPSWAISHERHFAPGSRILPRGWIMDYADRKDEFIREYEARNTAIVQFFASQPDRLLVYPLCAGAGWVPLCEFLGVPVPTREFPVNNVTRRVGAGERPPDSGSAGTDVAAQHHPA